MICTEKLRNFAENIIDKMKTLKVKQARFELRLSEEDKLFFEKASRIGGYKTLSSFVITALRRYATQILKEKEQILKSQEEKELFFDAIFSDNEPNEKLKKATKKYMETLSAK